MTGRSRPMTVALVAVGLIICTLSFGRGYLAGEDIRENGREVLFELRPVDPRSLLLGDYMTLRYELGIARAWGRELEDESLPDPKDLPDDVRSGVAEFALDANNVARIVNLQALPKYPKDAQRIRYQWPYPNRITIDGERYYFQSGTGERYENAAYGIFRIMPDGRALLTGLADEKRRPILTAGEAPGKRKSED